MTLGAKQSLSKHIFWQEEKDMKLAEHIQREHPHLNGYHYICISDCPRCAQLSLLQQIVDDLDGNLSWSILEAIIEEYKAIIEGSK